MRPPRWVRPWGLALLGSLVVAGLLMAAVALGRDVPRHRVLQRLPARDAVSTSLAGTPTFAGLRAGYVADVLGADLQNFLVIPAGEPSADGERARTPGTARPPGTAPSPGGAPPGAPPSGTSILGTEIFRFARLEVTMRADRASVQPGEHVTYRIVVANTGTADFDGELSATSHHPFGTTDSTTPCGDEVGVRPDPDEPCVAPAAPVPGVPADDVHTVNFSYQGPIPAGEQKVFEFRVRVNPGTPPGTELVNHAHLDVVGDGEAAVTSNTVRVRVR